MADETPPVGFEWDVGKAATNVPRHGVAFQEAATAFQDPLALASNDEEHSAEEQRFKLIGRSTTGRLLTVCYTMRGDVTRVISAWSATTEDRLAYETGNE